MRVINFTGYRIVKQEGENIEVEIHGRSYKIALGRNIVSILGDYFLYVPDEEEETLYA